MIALSPAGDLYKEWVLIMFVTPTGDHDCQTTKKARLGAAPW
jgi:hypothetical protein